MKRFHVFSRDSGFEGGRLSETIPDFVLAWLGQRMPTKSAKCPSKFAKVRYKFVKVRKMPNKSALKFVKVR